MYLIDSNILIYFLTDDSGRIGKFLGNLKPLAISEITLIEVLSYRYNDEELAFVQKFLQENFNILPLTRQISLQTAKNRRQKKSKTPDAIIGATAICHHCILVTNNEKDFNHLPINIINPFYSIG
ncbi:type II toxin-antitoxin system VapC family toxin [Moraxella oblonga]|uniref:type II toxin-antitoxin system VapC family toxin n=1 Tax=Moraxella oblonga TaxID=200413 RepID=UPI000834C9E5|nr:type II toxin-antitoxin system VapC family toxin [Moraxella oblonga]